jgi:hypothetical protein
MKLPAFLALGLALACTSCVEKRSKDEEIAAALAERSANRPLARKYEPVPVPGALPLMAVLAGQGAGPIRIGANVAQVERLMQNKCEIRTENLCRYVRYGIDFNLVGGITQTIYIQRRGRPAGKGPDGTDLEFGYFQGMIPPDLKLGMLPESIQQYLGKPYRIEAIPGPNPQTAVSRHYYPGLTLEYDFVHETKKHMLGAIFIHKDPLLAAGLGADAGAPRSDAGAPFDAGMPRLPDGGRPPFGDAGTRPPRGDAGAPRVKEPEPR